LEFLNRIAERISQLKLELRVMSENIRVLELKKIRPSRLNPRLEINIARIHDLAASIREVGLLEPIIVRPVDAEYEVVVGERRYRASQQAGLERVPAIVREYSDDEVVQINLIENVQREELSAIEKGKVCKYLVENCKEKYASAAEVAKKIGVSANTVALWMRSVEIIPREAQKYVAPSTVSGQVPEGKIDYATAVQVGRVVEEPAKRVEIIRKLAEERLPVKTRAEVIRKTAEQPEKPIEQVIREVEEAHFEMQFTADDKKGLVNGSKTQSTSLNAPDSKVKAGAIVRAVIWEPDVAKLRVASVERKKLRYFDTQDAEREGGYTLEEFKRRWHKLHGEWDEEQLVYITHFEKVK
jgi:ParB family chromosome partitioning protein